MRVWQGVMLVGGVGLASAIALVEPGLPAWEAVQSVVSEEDEWVAGELLLTEGSVPGGVRDGEDDSLGVAEPAEAEISVEEISTDEIPEQYWPDYFGERPEKFLVDPQRLLSKVDYRDRLEFLDYHAGDSAIDLYIYLFKGDQDLPGEVREEELVERLFSEGRPAAVVYYFMGAPQRSVFYLSPSLTDTVSGAEQRRALESSVIQAFEKVDPTAQIEAFLVQMSIRLYWMERMMNGDSPAATPEPVFAKAGGRDVSSADRVGALQLVIDKVRPYAFSAGVLLGLMVLAFVSKRWMRSRARYRFPEIEVEPRLGGAHAAGVGAVISFASAALPPASQRNQVPGYLRRA